MRKSAAEPPALTSISASTTAPIPIQNDVNGASQTRMRPSRNASPASTNSALPDTMSTSANAGRQTQPSSATDNHENSTATHRPAAARLAKRLFQLDGFSRVDVAKHLSKVNEFSQLVASEYVSFFDFGGDPLDRALRKFVERCVIVGETQERERVLYHFARRFYECNPKAIDSVDAAHTLTCALMLLNVDLHGGKTPRKMQLNEFVQNLAGLNDGHDFPKELLKELFNNVRKEALPFPPADSVAPLDAAFDRVDSAGPASTAGAPTGVSTDPTNANGGAGAGAKPASPSGKPTQWNGPNPFLDVPDVSKTTLYSHTLLMRKCVLEPGGRRSPLGRRSWHLYYAALCDLIIYMFKNQDEFCAAFGLARPARRNSLLSLSGRKTATLRNVRQSSKSGANSASDHASPSKNREDEKSMNNDVAASVTTQSMTNLSTSATVSAAVRLHHAFAEKAGDYKKKENVFRLCTADGAEYLFQAANQREMIDWTRCINQVAARLSAPVLPGAVGSTAGNRFAARFQRPLLPSTVTRLSLIQQLVEHRKQLTRVDAERTELARSHQQTLAQGTNAAKSKSQTRLIAQEHEEKRKYLELEYRRFGTYVQLIEKECEKELAQVTATSDSLLRQPISEDRENEDSAEWAVSQQVAGAQVEILKYQLRRTCSDRYAAISSRAMRVAAPSRTTTVETVISVDCANVTDCNSASAALSPSAQLSAAVENNAPFRDTAADPSLLDKDNKVDAQTYSLDAAHSACNETLFRSESHTDQCTNSNSNNGERDANARMVAAALSDMVDLSDASSLCQSGRSSLGSLSVTTVGSAPVMCTVPAVTPCRYGLPTRASVSSDREDAVASCTPDAVNQSASPANPLDATVKNADLEREHDCAAELSSC